MAQDLPLPSNINSILIQALHDMFDANFTKNHPFLDRMRKVTAGGSGYRIPVMTGPGGGAGVDFISSLGNASVGAFTGLAFVPVPHEAYGHEVINWAQRAFTMSQEQSAVDVAVLATKNAMLAASDNLASLILGAAAGVLGTISSNTNPSGTTYNLVLTVPTDAAKFNPGDVLQSAASASSAVDSGTASVVFVNNIQGSILVDAGSTGWTPTNAHVLGRQSSIGSSAVLPQPVFAWCPPAASRTNGVVGDTFLGVTRTAAASQQVVATSGWAFSQTNGMPISTLVQNVAGYLATYAKAKPNVLYCNPTVIAKMAQEFNAQVRPDMPSATSQTIGFQGFEIATAAGRMEVLAEPAMPANQLLMTKADSWVYATPQGKVLVPATNGKILVDAYGLTEGNVSRASLMSTGFFGCDNLWTTATITIPTPSGVNL
jgi:hypothetical protein